MGATQGPAQQPPGTVTVNDLKPVVRFPNATGITAVVQQLRDGTGNVVPIAIGNDAVVIGTIASPVYSVVLSTKVARYINNAAIIGAVGNELNTGDRSQVYGSTYLNGNVVIPNAVVSVTGLAGRINTTKLTLTGIETESPTNVQSILLVKSNGEVVRSMITPAVLRLSGFNPVNAVLQDIVDGNVNANPIGIKVSTANMIIRKTAAVLINSADITESQVSESNANSDVYIGGRSFNQIIGIAGKGGLVGDGSWNVNIGNLLIKSTKTGVNGEAVSIGFSENSAVVRRITFGNINDILEVQFKDIVKIGLFGVDPIARGAAIAAPAGGTIVDTQARTAINSLIAAIRNIGITA